MDLLLPITIFLPLAGAIAMLPLARLGRGAVRLTALVVTLITLAMAIVLIASYQLEAPHDGPFAQVDVPWLGAASGFDIRFDVALDGVSLWLFGLSALLMVTSVLVSWEAIDHDEPLFYAMLLLLECGCLGVFTAGDIILFYVFFEFTLIPLFFLIGVWGSEQRRYAAVKFFLFTLAGSVLTFLGLLTIVLWAGGRIGVAGAWTERSFPGAALSVAPELTFSIEKLTARLGNQYDELFGQLDRNRDENLSLAEAVGHKLGPRRERAKQAFFRRVIAGLDTDRNGRLSLFELFGDAMPTDGERQIYMVAFFGTHAGSDRLLSLNEFLTAGNFENRDAALAALSDLGISTEPFQNAEDDQGKLKLADFNTVAAEKLAEQTSWQLAAADLQPFAARQLDQLTRWQFSRADIVAMDFNLQLWIFLALFIGFAIKVPLFPLHTWLPLAHVQAPTAGSVFLAGILLKIGTYGFLRFSVPMLPAATAACVPWLLWLSVAGILYGALVALAQSDMKKLIAYSSVSHLGFCMLGLFALNALGTQGAVLQMINHGISTGALFAIVGMLYERYHTRQIKDLGGLAVQLPWLAFFMVLFTMSSIGLPGLNGFAGEFLILLGMFQRAFTGAPSDLAWQMQTIAVLAVAGVVLGAWYMLWLVQRVFFGPLKQPHRDEATESTHSIRDLSLREICALAPLAVFVFWIGLSPGYFLQPMESTLSQRTAQAEAALDSQLASGEALPVGHVAGNEPANQKRR